MTQAGLTFAIYPEGESVSLTLFRKSIEDIHRLITDVDYAVTREKGLRRWVVSELRSSIPTITLTPLLGNEETMEAIAKGLGLVAGGSSEPPAFFTEQALEDLRRMRRLFTGRDRARRLEFSRNGGEKTILWKDIGEKVEKILTGGYWNLGSLEGTLEAINLHGSPMFTIWDRVSRAPVRCFFPSEVAWKQRVKDLLEKRILVSGKVNYFRNGVPRSVSDIAQIDEVTVPSGPQKATFGSIPSEEASRDIVGFLHGIRERRTGNASP